MINPWPGLASYTEDSKDIFYGRSAESATLSALIRRNLFVTLYGRSGIGKTSLLQAGVFPLLRGDNSLCPIRIRLKEIKSEVEENKAKTEIKGKRNKKQTNESKEEVVTEDSKEKEAAPAAELLWGKVIDELKKEGVEYLPCDENDMYEPEFSDVMVLRNIFSAGRFWKTDNNEEIIPVIVIDQFEEVLYKAPKASRLLVSQLQALIDDNYDLTIPHPTWHEDTIFRIVVSIREDDLFLFEDCIDKLNCVDLKSNRYRLMPLTREEAEEVVTSPASAIEMFKADEKEEIVKKIIKISCNIGENVNTLMLSLICHVLYDKYVKEGKAISEAVLAQFDDIIILYYLSVLTEKKLPKREIEWFEDNLIDEQGRRKSVYESDFEKFAPNALQSEKNEYSDGNHQHNPDKSEKNDTIEANTDTKSHANTNNNQLFNISQGRVEFIHDQLAASVFEVRNSRKSKKYLRNSLILMVVALAALFSYSITQFPEPKELKKEIVSSKELVDLANNTKVIEYTIDSIDSRSYNQDYEINDCPNLKTINIGKRYARVNLYHCPSLVTINYPADFKGIVRVYNCPNLISSDEHCSSISIYGRDTAYLSEYGSPYEQSCISAKRYDKQISICDPNICVWNSLPYFCYRDNQGIYYMDRIITGIPDSIKKLMDCYVPWGYRDRFSQLREFQVFRSIKELSLLDTVKEKFKIAYSVFESYGYVYWIAICTLLIFCCYSIHIYCKKFFNYRSVYRVFLSIVCGIGSVLFVILAYLAIYWFSFNILFSDLQFAYLFNGAEYVLVLSNVLGGIAVVCGSLLVLNYEEFFLWFRRAIIGVVWQRIKYFVLSTFLKVLKYKYKSFWSKLTSNIGRHRGLYVLFLICIIGLGCLYAAYDYGMNKRKRYLQKLSYVDDIARISVLIDELEKQHGSVFYPFFSDSIKSLKEKYDNIEPSLVRRISLESLWYEACKAGVNLSYTEMDLKAVSMDGHGLCITMNNKYTGVKSLLYYNFINGLIDTISTENNINYTDFVFSPSGNRLMAYGSNGKGSAFVYVVDKEKAYNLNVDFSNRHDLIMTNDIDYYYLSSSDELMRGRIKHQFFVEFLNSFSDVTGLCYIDAENIGVYGDKNFYIYSVKQDTIIYKSKPRPRWIDGWIIDEYDIRGVNSKYVVSGQGLYDIHRDSLIINSDSIYMFNNRPVTISTPNNQFIMRELNGKVIKKINLLPFDDYRIYDLCIAGNYLFITDGYETKLIYVFSLKDGMNKQRVKITDEDKKMFDLD